MAGSNLKIDHLPRLRGFGALPGYLQHGDPIPANLLLQVTKLPLHFIAAADLVDKLSLERVHVRVQLRKTELVRMFWNTIS